MSQKELPAGAIKGNKAVQLLCANTLTEIRNLIAGMAQVAFESHPEVDANAYLFDIELMAFVPKPDQQGTA